MKSIKAYSAEIVWISGGKMFDKVTTIQPKYQWFYCVWMNEWVNESLTTILAIIEIIIDAESA